MGQYYKPVNVKSEQHVYSHDYGSGLKLMEHSYIGNDFVSVVENLLTPEGAWYKAPIVWAGDYADVEPGTEGTGYEGKGRNLYDLVEDNKIKPELKRLDSKYRYLVNHSKRVFVDLQTVEEFEEGWRIHPLPLLTVEGNGRGGGDFRGEDDRVGTWARDSISLEETAPLGFEQVDGTFKE